MFASLTDLWSNLEPGTLTQLILGVVAGIGGLIILLMLLAPLYIPIGMFVNKPGKKKSSIHFFTFIEQGQFKIIVRGERVIRMIMDTPGSHFVGERSGKSSSSKEYWEIDRSGSHTTDPLDGITPLLKPWAWYVLITTGAVFTGIWPFQKVREYSLERTKIYTHEDEVSDTDNTSPQSKEKAHENLKLIVQRDVSDHFRNRLFNFPIHITEAETKDKVPLDILLVAELRVKNGINVAFGTDRWDRASKNMITDAVIAKVRTLTVDDVLSAETNEQAQAVANDARERTVSDLEEFVGIEMMNLRTLQLDPVLKGEEAQALRAEAIAIQKAKATRLDGGARADALRSINKANEEGGEAALAAMHGENFVRAAEAAGKGNGTVIMNPPGGKNNSESADSAILKAMLVEMQKRNREDTK